MVIREKIRKGNITKITLYNDLREYPLEHLIYCLKKISKYANTDTKMWYRKWF